VYDYVALWCETTISNYLKLFFLNKYYIPGIVVLPKIERGKITNKQRRNPGFMDLSKKLFRKALKHSPLVASFLLRHEDSS